MSDRRLRPRKQPKQERAYDSRERILDSAAHIFAEHGYSAGTTNRIAEHANMSIGSIYQYFPNKDAVLATLMERHIAAGRDMFVERLSNGLPEALDDLLRLFVRAMIDNHREDAALHRVLFEQAPRPPKLLAALHDDEDQLVAAATALLTAHPGVHVADVGVAARIAVATIESLVHRLLTAAQPVDAAILEDEIVVMLSGYLRSGPVIHP